MLDASLFIKLGLVVAGCVTVPFVTRSLSGGGSAATTVSSPQQTESTRKEAPETLKIVKLVLSGTNSRDGVVVELFQKEGEEGKWAVRKATWLGESWTPNWTLYSDDGRGEYTFTDNTKYEHQRGCWGYARFWKNKKVCFSRNTVVDNDLSKWKHDFPKIKLTGWRTRFNDRGYIGNLTLDKLRKCAISVKERGITENTVNLEVTISCEGGSLTKNLNGTIVKE